MSGGQKEIRSWTALRGIFILGIVLYHVSGDYQQPFGVFSEACRQGGLWGNSFFFLTSGLVCAMSLNRSGDGIRFLRNRVRRVYPWYAATNGLMLLLNVLRHGVRWQITLSDTVPVFLMTSSGWVRDLYPYNLPTWFISTLMLVSLVFAAVHSLRKKNRLLYGTVCLLLACWGRVLMISGWNVPFCYVHDGEALFGFFLGVLLCEVLEAAGVLRDASAPDPAGKGHGLVSAILILVLAGAAVLSYTVAPELSGDLQLTITLFYVPAILYLAAACRPVRVLLECPPLVALGRISMPVFFLHMPLRELHNAWLDPWFVSLGVPNAPRLLLYLLILLLCGATGNLLSGCLRRKKRNNPVETGESPGMPDQGPGKR